MRASDLRDRIDMLRIDLKTEPEILSEVIRILLENAISVATKRCNGHKTTDRALFNATKEQDQIWRVIARDNNWNPNGFRDFVKDRFGISL